MAGAAAPATAQSRPASDLSSATLEDLMKITITTASLGPETAANAPARVQVVTADQIRRRGYRSLIELLQDLPDVKVDLRGDPDYPAQLVVQGSRGADRVIVLLDGVRISSPTNEPLPILANFPVHAARQVEIVYGPASALYGADAFSAVINIISRSAADGTGLSVSTSIGQFGLYDQTAAFTGRAKGASILVAGQAQYDAQPDLSRFYPADFGDLHGQRTNTFDTIFGPMSSLTPVSAAFSAPTAGHSIQSVIRAGGWQFLAFQSAGRASTTSPNTPDNAVYNAGIFNRSTLFVGSAGYTRRVGPVTSSTVLTYGRHQLDPQSGYQNVYSNMQRSYKYAFGSRIDVDERLSWQPATSLHLIAGGTVERFTSVPQGADLNAPVSLNTLPGTLLGTDIPDLFIKLQYFNSGLYGQAQYAVSPKASFTVGGRFDYNSRYGASLNPRAGLVLTPGGGTTLKLLAGRAFLAPSPYQAYSHYGSFTSTDGGVTYSGQYWHVPNPDLQPQRKTTLEASLTQAVGSGLQIAASGFYSRYTHLIKEADADRASSGMFLGWPVAYIDFPVNEGNSQLYGGTFGAEYLHSFGATGRLHTNATVAYVDGGVSAQDPSESDGSLPMGSIAPLQVRLIADIDWGRWSFAPRLAVEGAQRLEAVTDAGRRRTLPGYARLDLHVRREVAKGLTLFVTVENALDARYRNINVHAFLNPVELIGAPQNPRRISVGASLGFGGLPKEQH
jgi:outer membrane receptor protein involved in Fe transport